MKSVDNHKILLYQYDRSHLNQKLKQILHFELKKILFFIFKFLPQVNIILFVHKSLCVIVVYGVSVSSDTALRLSLHIFNCLITLSCKLLSKPLI